MDYYKKMDLILEKVGVRVEKAETENNNEMVEIAEENDTVDKAVIAEENVES